MTNRFAFVFALKPGARETYRERHDAIWPEMLELLARVGISDYSIFADGDTLFGVLKSSRPWHEVAKDLAASTVQARWGESMADLIEWQLDDDGNLRALTEVFRFDGPAET